jgi:hypothetical protein
METDFNGPANPEDLEARQDSQLQENAEGMEASAEQSESRKRKHHEDHHVNRKYRLFSNHSSYGDSPHTNTSI